MSCGGGTEQIKVDWNLQEDPEKLAAFEARIDRGELIEPGDWMPHNYRAGMLKMAEHHANSEIVGALPEGEWITRAPCLRRKLALIAKVQDEVGHGQMLYRVSQDLGKSRDAMLRDLITGRTRYHNVFNYPAPTWADVAAIQWLVDGAAIMNQKSLADGSYGPYVRTMKRINMEEAFHFKSGEDMVLTLMSGTKRQKQMMQEAFDRWWWPCVMFFGPPDKDSVKTAPFMRWRIKTATNDELRQKFVDRFSPAALDLGLKINVVRKGLDGMVLRKPDGAFDVTPDPLAKLDEKTGRWGFSTPDWDEFYRVIKGGGPLNKERVALRRFSYEQGQWVRRAVMNGANAGAPPGRN
ncbi:MAG: 1,2-phenylacetyl-CoA epoxidase subunit A [Phycisphaerae bacterium]|nr:MAG: 1,2-phenylacetyl-CoA epoxidase subunit A [Planctomycetota bacterium]KAB2945428.1 MAG: 1,2-phenylacetyl-CoA epoxidase subunit A [Phycisphaerae bacterium]MBE7458155.1 1,2-phenylacetyl-CoA epoxidase subunit A [Planctomycetia bacterium]MCK6464379.1 1,2-phenylacetyl-CoA epoxidase subunit A [Phycisphaerae bacterium]MCL4718069.1 1,2-phenylacetyl-CoA epoxidase subunit A [Phycisphaerae bacterium]